MYCFCTRLAVAVLPVWGMSAYGAEPTAFPETVKARVDVARWGRCLQLDYETVGGGRQSSGSLTADPPQFTVYRDGQEIASGSFRYG